MRLPLFMLGLFLGASFSLPAQSVNIGGKAVASWAYQLQGKRGAPLELAGLQSASVDLVVVDYSADGQADGEFTAQQVAALRGSGKIVLAYMSIGEAESYRFYWNAAWATKAGKLTDTAPSWLAKQDPDWPGNFKVRYWMPEWQQLVFGTTSGAQKSYLDRIMDAGFDGVYLDIIDAFEAFGPDASAHPERPTAAADMAAFVEAIAHYARSTRGVSGFLVVPQNGANVVDEISSSEKAAYFAAIDAIGAEDTFFYGPKGMNNAWNPQGYTMACLTQFSDAAKPVLAVEYVSTRAKAKRFQNAARGRGWVPLVAPRALDRVTSQP